MSLEDLCIPVAKIRMVADFFDIEHHGGVKKEHDFVEIEGQSLVGAHCTLLEVANEIEEEIHQEAEKWIEEGRRYIATIANLEKQLAEIKGVVHDNN